MWWRYVILDEGHIIKNEASDISKAVRRFHFEHVGAAPRFWLDRAFVRAACDVDGTLLLDARVPESMRDDETAVRAAQLAGGGPGHGGVSPVPEAALDGHAYHTYAMTSADGQVEFQVRHNVNGRSTYAEVCAGLLSLSRG